MQPPHHVAAHGSTGAPRRSRAAACPWAQTSLTGGTGALGSGRPHGAPGRVTSRAEARRACRVDRRTLVRTASRAAGSGRGPPVRLRRCSAPPRCLRPRPRRRSRHRESVPRTNARTGPQPSEWPQRRSRSRSYRRLRGSRHVDAAASRGVHPMAVERRDTPSGVTAAAPAVRSSRDSGLTVAPLAVAWAARARRRARVTGRARTWRSPRRPSDAGPAARPVRADAAVAMGRCRMRPAHRTPTTAASGRLAGAPTGVDHRRWQLPFGRATPAECDVESCGRAAAPPTGWHGDRSDVSRETAVARLPRADDRGFSTGGHALACRRAVGLDAGVPAVHRREWSDEQHDRRLRRAGPPLPAWASRGSSARRRAAWAGRPGHRFT